MNITGTHFNYYRVCQRKLWLFAKGINMEHNSDLVADGKLIEESSYRQRSGKYEQVELSYELEGTLLTGKIDFFDTKNKVIHETKRSNKVEVAHIWQVKFYLWLLVLNDIGTRDDLKGVIEYPTLRKTETVLLEDADIDYLEKAVLSVKQLAESETCPPVLNSKICKSCSYYDFCYAGET